MMKRLREQVNGQNKTTNENTESEKPKHSAAPEPLKSEQPKLPLNSETHRQHAATKEADGTTPEHQCKCNRLMIEIAESKEQNQLLQERDDS